MNIKQISLILAACFASSAQAQPKGPPEGWSGFFLNNVTFQKSSEDALRNRPTPGVSDPLVTDTGGRLQNSFALQYKRGDWSLMGFFTDNRTLGGGNAYSLTNPMTFGVNYVETTGHSKKAVNYKSGLHELAATYQKNGTMVMLGKIDTSNWYLYDRLFSGDLSNGMDYGNAATRVVAPPFPSMAMVVKQDFGAGWSLTGIVGDAFGDRETINAARNLVKGDLAYVAELNYEDARQHYQLTLNHVDAFRFYDKDAEWALTQFYPKAPKVDAVMASARYGFDQNWAVFGRASYARGDAQLEDINLLAGVRYDLGKFYALASQSASRMQGDTQFGFPMNRGAKGDYTWVSELTFNYKIHPLVTVGLTYDFYNASGNSLLAKDGGYDGAKRNHIVGMRVTSFLPF